ncbi:PEPxxWA-CTERM sorting domain-containing protein [Sphingomonas sp.]|uniref:PEPxxWA-CTERM sorting domain-containing protein n=1 Tax=Sphingomonas sp. TaxID=28214 RepID=UPI002ED93C92
MNITRKHGLGSMMKWGNDMIARKVIAVLVALLAATPGSASLVISSLNAADGDENIRLHSYLPNDLIQASSDGSSVNVKTDLGVNKIAARDENGGGVEAGSLWGANFRVGSDVAGPVRVTFSVRVDGSATPLIVPQEDLDDEDPPIAFNYFLNAVGGRVGSFDTDQSDGDIDAMFDGNHPVLASNILCAGESCGFDDYDSLLALQFDVAAGEEFFVYGLLQLSDLHYANFAFANTALLQGITLSNNATLTSDTGLLVQGPDGSFNFQSALTAAAVPEPSQWALIILGFAMIGYALRGDVRRHAPDLKFLA